MNRAPATPSPRKRLPGDLRLFPTNPRGAMVASAVSAGAVTLAILFIDSVLFRGRLSSAYVSTFTVGPLAPRMASFMLRSVYEETAYRLGVMTALVAIACRLQAAVSPVVMIAVIILAQLANVWPLILADPAYASLRYLAVGCVWGWLYWRHGWVSAVGGHVGAHLALDPLLVVALKT
jgi:hypothetical protein